MPLVKGPTALLGMVMQTNPGCMNEGLVTKPHQREVFLSVFLVLLPSQIYLSYSNHLTREVRMNRNDPNANYLRSRAKTWHCIFQKTSTPPCLCELALCTLWINDSQWRRTGRNLLLRSWVLSTEVQCPPQLPTVHVSCPRRTLTLCLSLTSHLQSHSRFTSQRAIGRWFKHTGIMYICFTIVQPFTCIIRV